MSSNEQFPTNDRSPVPPAGHRSGALSRWSDIAKPLQVKLVALGGVLLLAGAAIGGAVGYHAAPLSGVSDSAGQKTAADIAAIPLAPDDYSDPQHVLSVRCPVTDDGGKFLGYVVGYAEESAPEKAHHFAQNYLSSFGSASATMGSCERLLDHPGMGAYPQ
ncbi:hypothetical protein [Corynebacterium aquilae]|uniref:Uncharacterized protein n=1 Tax=Corynebacterium aquilae DSM 44791 TaxID=1431546 RepID=A0A1L7CHU4_9CORY|nr:hypothetical protein [Corynebacterium aquilae]APT85414.1 hypothetical protein CAQU_10535 [Corynebacterium aquilae DSM 44791]